MSAAPDPRPLLALTAGDPAGVGPELVARLLAEPELARRVRVLALGPEACRPACVPPLAPGADPRALTAHAWLATSTAHDWELGRPQAAAGRAALAALRAGHELALARRVDALVCAPVSKEALHLAGERVEGQTELLGRWAGTSEVEMLGLARELRVLLLTRHVPLSAALAAVTSTRVVAHLELLDRGLRRLGFAAPRLALAGLNPHAGENGLLGREDGEQLAPAVAEARARGLDVAGPLSPDTVFLRAARGEFTGVLALYHDQAFIPLKLHAPGEGLTVLLGLPYLRVSPAHGTAFDLAGTGRADAGNLRVALEAAARFAPSYSAGSASAARA
jgi:4-hydroxythreonine-4-phosphate dehydrogenase